MTMKKFFEDKYIKFAISLLSVILLSIIFYFIVLRIDKLSNTLIGIIRVFTPFIYGLIIAYILNPLIKFFENKIFNKLFKNKTSKKKNSIIRSSSIVSASIIFLILLYLVLFKIFPELFVSIQNIVANIPSYINKIKDYLLNIITNADTKEVILDNYDTISNYVTNFLNEKVTPKLDEIIITISGGIIVLFKTLYNFVMGFIISIYLLFNKEKFIGQFKKLIYSIFSKNIANKILYNLRYINKVFGGFFLGKIIDSLIIGLICFGFMFIFNMPYAVLISAIVAITNIIPYFGPFIGAIPSTILILLVNPDKVIGFIVFIFILQQFDGTILGPKILGKNTGLSSFWVLFSILVFGSIFGFVGMVIGVPMFAVIYSIIHNSTNSMLNKKNLPTNSSTYSKMKYIDDNDELKY